MRNVFLDTNVLVDYLAQRSGYFDDALLIVSLAIDRKINLFVAAMSFATASYLMEKHYNNDSAAVKTAIANFIKYCYVTVVDRKTIEDSASSDFDDFEDGMQYSAALSCDADFIVTRNAKDFETSIIEVVSPTEFLKEITK